MIEMIVGVVALVLVMLGVVYWCYRDPSVWKDLKAIGRMFREALLHPINPSPERVRGRKPK